MKAANLVLLITYLIATTSSCKPDEDDLGPYPIRVEGLDITEIVLPKGAAQSIDFINKDTAYVSAYFGLLLRSVDGGDTWSELSSIDRFSNLCVNFLNQDLGFLGGNNSGGIIYKSVDGGQEWNEVFYSPNSSPITKIVFLDSTLGYAISGHKLLKTSNGGEDWHETPYTGGIMTDIEFNDSIIAVSVSQGNVLISKNRGATFRLVGVDNKERYNSVTISDNGNIILGGSSNILRISTDTGNTWQPLSINNSINNIFEILLLNDNRMFAFGRSGGASNYTSSTGSILYSLDKGQNWMGNSIYGVPYFVDVYSLNDSSGVVLTSQKIIKFTIK